MESLQIPLNVKMTIVKSDAFTFTTLFETNTGLELSGKRIEVSRRHSFPISYLKTFLGMYPQTTFALTHPN